MTERRLDPIIDSHTTLYGVIGDPVIQSKSPLMMNAAFRESGINGAYAAFHITPDKLEGFVTGVRAMGIRGVNVTIPHKLAVMGLLDDIHPDAKAIGAVNTIVNDNGRLVGYNTDGIGYVRSLKEEAEPLLPGKKIVVLGAGGASRGIIYALLRENPREVVIANRTADKAYDLAKNLGGIEAGVAGIPYDALKDACSDADIVINTTSVGMFPHPGETPIPGAWLKPGAVASDLIYNPLKTEFLRQAEERGCRIHGGLGMFIYQGAYAFEYWTGVPAPVEIMKETVLATLGRV